MTKKYPKCPSPQANNAFIEIEVDVTPEEDAKLHRIAAVDGISVAELLRREALRAANEPFLQREFVPVVLNRLREMSEAALNSSTLSSAELAETLLDLANALEQLIGPASVAPKTQH